MIDLEKFSIIGDFVLCEEIPIGKSDQDSSSKEFIIKHENSEMTSDNLLWFKVVKLPNNADSITTNGFSLGVGDEVISISLGTEVGFSDMKKYKIFETKYIVAKREGIRND